MRIHFVEITLLIYFMSRWTRLDGFWCVAYNGPDDWLHDYLFFVSQLCLIFLPLQHLFLKSKSFENHVGHSNEEKSTFFYMDTCGVYSKLRPTTPYAQIPLVEGKMSKFVWKWQKLTFCLSSRQSNFSV